MNFIPSIKAFFSSFVCHQPWTKRVGAKSQCLRYGVCWIRNQVISWYFRSQSVSLQWFRFRFDPGHLRVTQLSMKPISPHPPTPAKSSLTRISIPKSKYIIFKLSIASISKECLVQSQSHVQFRIGKVSHRPAWKKPREHKLRLRWKSRENIRLHSFMSNSWKDPFGRLVPHHLLYCIVLYCELDDEKAVFKNIVHGWGANAKMADRRVVRAA